MRGDDVASNICQALLSWRSRTRDYSRRRRPMLFSPGCPAPPRASETSCPPRRRTPAREAAAAAAAAAAVTTRAPATLLCPRPRPRPRPPIGVALLVVAEASPRVVAPSHGLFYFYSSGQSVHSQWRRRGPRRPYRVQQLADARVAGTCSARHGAAVMFTRQAPRVC